MRFFYSCLIFNLLSISVLADESPSNIPFKITSMNKAYFAQVSQNKSGWNLSVYQTKDSFNIWQTSYKYDGYASGSLTNNGEYFVYVNDWLCLESKNQICIYSKDTSWFYSGKELDLDSTTFPHTSSHQIWIKDWFLNDTNILIHTLNGESLEIELNGESNIMKQIQHNEKELEQIQYIKQLTIFVAGSIGLFIVGLFMSKMRAIKKRKEKL